MPNTDAIQVADASPEPAVRGEGLLKLLERPFVWADRMIDRALPEELNPLARTGAIANTTFLIAAVTGVLLLLWYVPSIHQAYDSVEAMAAAPFTAGLMRSLHRYSSDACVFFFTVHALKLFFARRFGGARWLAWVTGIFAVAVLWFTGWTGYWLVWDARGQQIALMSAQLMDVLPIFIDPLSRSFLVDAQVNTLLFFVIFFVHMLVPAGAVVALWLHITRLARANWLTNKPLSAWVIGSLVVLSLALPADLAEPASLASDPAAFSMDWWYLAPLLAAERMSAGMMWGVLLLLSLLITAIPWLLVGKRAVVATVDVSRCHSCNKCMTDCPYGAISMAERTDGRPFDFQAMVDPNLCVGCGICAGSCDTGGIGVPQLLNMELRKRVAGWASDGAPLAILCAEAAGEGLVIDPKSGACSELPGWSVLAVPCAGWVQPLVVESSLRAGAQKVVIGACGPGNCHFREGALHTELRMAGTREPALRHDKVDPSLVSVVRLGRGEKKRLLNALGTPIGPTQRSKGAGIAVGIGLAAAMAVIIGLLSVGPYRSALSPEPRLVVSLKHPGQVGEDCRPISAEEKAKMPIHMQQDEICERRRADVHIQVDVDGEQVLDATYEPAGLWGDGNSIAIERLGISEGKHKVTARLADGLDPQAWGWESEQTLEFKPRERHILQFGRNDGFTWH